MLISTIRSVCGSVPVVSRSRMASGQSKGRFLIMALHDLSSRRERAFVKLNCAAISLGLLESELPYMKEFLASNGVSRATDNGAPQ
jgi:transcriptional regulator of acetoin/glycerol metabolism